MNLFNSFINKYYKILIIFEAVFLIAILLIFFLWPDVSSSEMLGILIIASIVLVGMSLCTVLIAPRFTDKKVHKKAVLVIFITSCFCMIAFYGVGMISGASVHKRHQKCEAAKIDWDHCKW